jgi:hypothetical protein
MMASAIMSPIVVIIFGVYAIFVVPFVFMRGIHTGLIKNLYGKKEEEDMWGKHIERMQEKSKQN